MNKKTRICCIDTSEEIRNHLTGEGFFVFDGSFGTRISVGAYNKQNSYSNLLLNYVFPSNIQEYELFIIDMNNNKVIPYQKKRSSTH